jgi:proline dehydrogenase
MIRSGHNALRSCWLRVAARAARAYVAGPELSDAMGTCRLAAKHGFSSTIAFWNEDHLRPRQVADAHRYALDALGGDGPRHSCLALKAPALGFDASLISEILEQASRGKVAVHFDSLGPEAADATFALIRDEIGNHPAPGCTLPGRWRRSLEDAEVAVDLKLPARVVKGQWSDPERGESDPREGFLAVIDRLAGRASHVRVATHDPLLVGEALRRLNASRTSCEVELLFGLPLRPAIQAADAAGASVRIYVPYGLAWLRYSLSRACRNPRILGWILRDSFAGGAGPRLTFRD